MIKPQHVLTAGLGAALFFGFGLWAGQREPEIAPQPYRSKTSAASVQFEGVAGELRAALLERDLLVRTARVGAVLQQLGAESAQQVLAVYESVWLDLGQTELVLLADWWARFDPHAALEWAESDFRTAGTKVPFAVMRSWGRHDPSAALTRALRGRLGDPRQRITYEAAAIEGWEDSGMPGVIDHIRGLGSGEHRQRAIRGFTRRKVMREGVDQAFRWADALADEDKVFKLNVLRRIATDAASVNPVTAGRWVAKFEGSYYMRSLPKRIAAQWAKRDPIAAMAWLATLEASVNRAEGVREAFRSWPPEDWDAAAAWLRSGEHVAWKDQALAIYARRFQLDDPEKGARLAAEIIDDELRVSTQVFIVRTWASQDMQAATRWVEEESGMTQKQKHRALTFGERWRQGTAAAKKRRAKAKARAAAEQELLEAAPDPEPDEPRAEVARPGNV